MKTGDLVRFIYSYGNEETCCLYGKIGLVVATYSMGPYVDVLINKEIHMISRRRLEVICK